MLPILHSYLPEKSTGEFPWYVMPVAQPLEKHLENGKHIEDIALVIKDCCENTF